MMYRFELNKIDSLHIGAEMLRMTENICDDFGLDNDFGIVSTALQQLVTLIGTYTDYAPEVFSAVFIVDNHRLVVTLQHEIAMSQFESEVLKSNIDEVQMFVQLADNVKCFDEGRQFSMEFEIHPQRIPSAYADDNLAEKRQLTILEKTLDVNVFSDSKS